MRMARNSAASKASLLPVFASVCIVVAALYFAQSVLIPLALAVLISFLLSPLVEWLRRIHVPRVPATLIVVVVAMSLVGLIGYVVGRQLVSLVNDLPKYKVDIQAKLSKFRVIEDAGERVVTRLEEFGKVTKSAAQRGKNAVGADDGSTASKAPLGSPENPTAVRISTEPSTQIQTVGEWIGKFVYPLVTAGLVTVFVIFMLIALEDLRDRVVRLVGYSRIEMTTEALDEAGTRISQFLLAEGYVNAAYGVAVAGGLWVIGHTLARSAGGFPNVLLWGLICGVLRFVPYVGIWIGAGLSIIVSFALPGFAPFIATILMFGGYELTVSQFVEPYLYGSKTGLTPLAVLVAAVFWTWLWGPIGLLLSTPLTVCIVVIAKFVPQLQFLNVLLSDEPMLDPHLRLYQRLLALDEEEASEVARKQLDETSLEYVYDQMILPALVRAERDRNMDRLDQQRERFINETLRTIIEELGERARDPSHNPTQRGPAALPREETRGMAVATPVELPKLPEGCAINVLLLPARHEADELAALMLSQILQDSGYYSSVMSSELLSSELVQKVDQQKADIVVISAMPPGATANARYLCKRLKSRPQPIPMVIGLWNQNIDFTAVRDRLDLDESTPVVTTLVDAARQVAQLAMPIVNRMHAEQGNSSRPPGSRSVRLPNASAGPSPS
jgi:predicted PurR-regulated permease PerM